MMADWTFETWCSDLDSETATVTEVMACRSAYDMSQMRSEVLTASYLLIVLLAALLFTSFLRGRE